MNHTTNYQLSQWERTDKVQMEDFNADNAKIDAALKAEADARTALASEVSKLGNCRIEVQSYTGNGTYGANNPNRLTFSAPPKFLFIFKGSDFAFGLSGVNNGPVVIPSNAYAHNSSMTFVWKGNIVEFYCSTITAQLNQKNSLYHVVAFFAEDEA